MYPILENISFHHEEEMAKIYLPTKWWNTSYSYNFFAEESLPKTRIISLNNNKVKNINVERFNNFKNNLKSDLDKGDYFRQTDANQKGYAEYQKMKIKILKYSIYPFLILALFFTFFILNGIASFPK